jgi:hypothetical protein
MLGTPIESGGPDVDVVVELLQEYQRTAREAAATDLTDQPWDTTPLRGRVVDLLERGGRALALMEGSDAHPWCAITWTEADPPVVLARALAIVHQRLAAAAADAQATQTHGLMAAIGAERFRTEWREETFMAANRRPSRRTDLHDLTTSSSRFPRRGPSDSTTKPQSPQKHRSIRRRSR